MSIHLLETGQASVVASFIKWIQDNVPNPLVVPMIAGGIPYTVQPNRPLEVAPLPTPVVSINDIGLVQPQADDGLDVLTYSSSGAADEKRGRWASTVMELIVWAHARVQGDAEARIKFIVDAIRANYSLAGHVKPDLVTYYAPPIVIHDYTDPAKPATNNLIHPDRGSLWLVQGWLPNDVNPELKAWRMLTRVFWPEFLST